MTETALASTIDVPRFNMALLTAFAVIALALAGFGLATVISGIRMALGASWLPARRATRVDPSRRSEPTRR